MASICVIDIVLSCFNESSILYKLCLNVMTNISTV